MVACLRIQGATVGASMASTAGLLRNVSGMYNLRSDTWSIVASLHGNPHTIKCPAANEQFICLKKGCQFLYQPRKTPVIQLCLTPLNNVYTKGDFLNTTFSCLDVFDHPFVANF